MVNTNTTENNMTENGINAVAAVINGTEGYTFEGKFSNADVAAIAKAFTMKGFPPSACWLANLRRS